MAALERERQRRIVAIGSGGVLITGSVVTVGEARTLLTRPEAGARS